MFRISTAVMMAVMLFLAGCATSSTTSSTTSGSPSSQPASKPAASSNRTAHDVVEATERAFAKTMADRDFKAFKTFLSDEAIFISGPTPLRGKQSVAAAWQPYFEPPDAPFSWEPDQVIVLDSEGLALSSGPVSNPNGVTVGIFNSVWRREADGVWRIVFDKGSCACQ